MRSVLPKALRRNGKRPLKLDTSKKPRRAPFGRSKREQAKLQRRLHEMAMHRAKQAKKA